MPVLPSRLKALQGAGVNLAHHLAQEFVPAGQDFITDADVRSLKELDVTQVRIPVDMKIDWRNPERLDPDRLLRLRRLVGLCHENGLTTIITPFGDLNDRLGSQNSPTTLNTNTALAQRFWKEFASKLNDFDPEKTIFQVANEPANAYPEHWHPIQEKLISGIREVAPDHTLMTACLLKWGPGADNFGAVRALVEGPVPTDDNTVSALNMYEPYYFTHQLADFPGKRDVSGDPVAQAMKELPWYANPENTAGLVERLQKEFPIGPNSWAANWVKDYASRYPDSEAGRANDSRYLRDELGRLKNWMREKGRAVHLTESGVFKLGGVAAEERARYLRDLQVYGKVLGVGTTPWEFKAGFGIMDADGPAYVPKDNPQIMAAVGMNPARTGPAVQTLLDTEENPSIHCATPADDIIYARNANGSLIAPGEGNNLIIADRTGKADTVKLQGGYSILFKDKEPDPAQPDSLYFPDIPDASTLTFRKEGSHLIVSNNGKDVALLFEQLDKDNKNRGFQQLLTGPRENLRAYRLFQEKTNGQYLEGIDLAAAVIPPALALKPEIEPMGKKPGLAAMAVGTMAARMANLARENPPLHRRGFFGALLGRGGDEGNQR